MRLGKLQGFLDDLDALALQHIGKARVVLEKGMIELGDPLARMVIPVVNERRDDAARLELVVEADAVVKLQSRGMVGAGARHLLEEIVVAQRLDQADRDARLRQRQRQAQSDRPGADDDDALSQFFAATTSFTAPIQPVWVRSNTMPSGSLYLAS